MFMSKPFYSAFRHEGIGILPHLITPIFIYPELPVNEAKLKDLLSDVSNKNVQKYILNALWDTGATGSCIKPEIAQRIGLDKNTISMTQIKGVNSASKIAKVYRSGAMFLPNGFRVDGHDFAEADIASPADVILGMDLITMGDFSISNYGGKTVFCFSMPPHEEIIDLCRKNDITNSYSPSPPTAES